MKVPKHIEKLLMQHINWGKKLNNANCKLFEWLKSKGINIEITDIYCQNSILLLTEPYTYASGIKELIEENENE